MKEPDPSDLEETIFAASLAIASAEERRRYLDDACAGKPALREAVEALLAGHAEGHGILDGSNVFLRSGGPDDGRTTSPSPAMTESVGCVVGGRYKLLEQIGEGGMGVVFMAEQERPVRRRVALKVVKAGMDTKQVVARFEAERQALAVMDHPNIARVFDAGATDNGRPYFVMELVQGVPITRYCDARRLPVRERLALFVQVCQAVQHAHQKGIIHRDLKPTNVLVATSDGRPVPKVIDFGVAKALHQRLTDHTVFTSFGAVVGTLEYMSPEQAEMDLSGTDTRSDVYSLGVLLYELLTGTTPLDRGRLKDAAYGELLRIIREVEPPRPSTRISQSGLELLTAISARRGTDASRLVKFVAGDLDWIVLRSMEKDRNRRYETASALAADVQRFLSDEPVAARPPSAVYKFRKFARRNKGMLAMGVALAAVLLLATAVSAVLAVRATRSERLAERRLEAETRARSEAEAAKRDASAEAQRARVEAATSAAINAFLNEDLLAQGNLENEPDREVKLRTVLDRAAEKIESRFHDRPLVEAAVRQTLGSAYETLGELQKAEAHRRRAVELRRLHAGADHPDTLVSVAGFADSHRASGRPEEAVKLYEQALSTWRERVGADHPATFMLMAGLTGTYMELGRREDARRVAGETLMLAAKSGPDDSTTLAALNNLANALGPTKEALKLHEALLPAIRAARGPDHPDSLTSAGNLAGMYFRLGRHDEAFKLAEETLATKRVRLGADHPNTLRAANDLAVSYEMLDRYDDAVRLGEETLALYKAKLGPNHPDTIWSMQNLASFYSSARRQGKAVALMEEVLALQTAKRGADHPDTIASLKQLAEIYVSDALARESGRDENLKQFAAGEQYFRGLAGRAKLQKDGPGAAANAAKFIATAEELADACHFAVAEMQETAGPFHGAPASVPGRIEAEDFDRGGQGVAFYDATLQSSAGVNRRTLVDVEPCRDDGGGDNAGHAQQGEWLNYTVDVAQAGEYDFELRVASGKPGGQLHVEVDGVDVTGTLDVPNTGNWQVYETVTRTGIRLGAGRQVIRVSFDRNGSGVDCVCNLNWIAFRTPTR